MPRCKERGDDRRGAAALSRAGRKGHTEKADTDRLREGIARVPKQAGPKREKQKKNKAAAMKAEKDRARRSWRSERPTR